MIPIDRLMTSLMANGEHTIAPPLDREEANRLFAQWGRLPDHVVEFYRHCNGMTLFSQAKRPFPSYRIQPLDQLMTIQEAMGLEDWSSDDLDLPPRTWLAINDAGNDDWIALNSETGQIIDCFHETVAVAGYRTIIALSFTEFLNHAAASHGKPYWLEKDAPQYGAY